jgi:hypothetical protein
MAERMRETFGGSNRLVGRLKREMLIFFYRLQFGYKNKSRVEKTISIVSLTIRNMSSLQSRVVDLLDPPRLSRPNDDPPRKEPRIEVYIYSILLTNTLDCGHGDRVQVSGCQ